jgi:phage/plasmid-associated DNA primase
VLATGFLVVVERNPGVLRAGGEVTRLRVVDVVGAAEDQRGGSAVNKATTGDLHVAFEKWRITDGAEPMSQKAFGQALDKMGYPAGPASNSKRWRVGISLIRMADDESAA